MVMTLPPIFIANQVGTGGGGGITSATKFVLSQDIVFPPSHESHSHSRLICSLLMARNTPFLGVCSYSLHFARHLFCSRAEKPKRSASFAQAVLDVSSKAAQPTLPADLSSLQLQKAWLCTRVKGTFVNTFPPEC